MTSCVCSCQSYTYVKTSQVENIVEGFGRRRYKQEFVKFLTYSLASCDETQEHLDTLHDTKSLDDKERYEYFCEEYNHLGRMIVNFIKSVDSSHKTKATI